MAKLILSYNGDVINEYQLDRGSLSIGRDKGNDIHIDNPAVSSKHARILTILSESFIEDLDSTNGTYINNSKISGHSLKNGECIFIGEHKLNYINTDMEDGKRKNISRLPHEDKNQSKNETKDIHDEPSD